MRNSWFARQVEAPEQKTPLSHLVPHSLCSDIAKHHGFWRTLIVYAVSPVGVGVVSSVLIGFKTTLIGLGALYMGSILSMVLLWGWDGWFWPKGNEENLSPMTAGATNQTTGGNGQEQGIYRNFSEADRSTGGSHARKELVSWGSSGCFLQSPH